jgi:protein arginine kinase activator
MDKCEFCGQRDAQIDITGIVNGKETSLHLCQTCAEENGISPTALDAVSLAKFLERCMTLGKDTSDDIELSNLTMECPECGSTRSEIEDKGVFGCEYCYTSFRDMLDLDSPDADDSDNGGGAPKPKPETEAQTLRRLKRRLQEAVDQEAYEDAASIRDQIRDLQGVDCGA